MASDAQVFQVLRTRRLELVRPELAHAAALFEIHGDPQAVRFLPRPLCKNLDACGDLVQKMRDLEGSGQGFRWTIRHRGEVVGALGFHAWNREKGRAQLSYELVPSARGCGIASEAVVAVLHFGWQKMALAAVEAEAHHQNRASIALLERLSFHSLGGYARIWKDGGTVWFERFELRRPSP